MVIAGAIASRGLNDLTANHLNAAIRQDVIDPHGRALVAIDKIRWDRISAPRRRDCVFEPQFTEGVEDLLATVDEAFDGGLCARREVAKRLHQLTTIDGVLGANAVEIAADDDRTCQSSNKSAEIESLVFG